MERIGRYELRERIGEGAMAEVWRAYDPSIDRVLAIKLLKLELRAQPESAARFLREARAAGALSHPAIVTIYDVGEADGFPYIAMELLDGRPLDEVLKDEGKLSIEQALAIGGQLASALSYAHLSGVIHRDIKPSNIMLARDRESIKILDFGIARVGDAREGEGQVKTQYGQVLGTPRYMSPEQALGREVDGRSDLFSVGAVLYEVVTGHPAFDGTSAATLALQITQAEPAPIGSIEPGCPGGLRFIIEKLLAKRPERRFADGLELARGIGRERRAYEAVKADASTRHRTLSLPVRITLAMVVVTAIALTLSLGTILDRQYRAMERMALASGSSIASFVASNAALPAVDNATLPADQRDWLPVQAFIAAAAKDESVRWMTMVDRDGIVRGASDPKLIGTHYQAPRGEMMVQKQGNVTVTDLKLADGRPGFRFVHPILYAGKSFGTIEVSISKAELQTAARTSRNLLIALAALVLTVVTAVSFTVARLIAQPLRRLRAAMRDSAMGDLDFRLSHRQKGEIGELFDSFNLMITAMQERLAAAENPAGRVQPLEETRVAAEVVAEPVSPDDGEPVFYTPPPARQVA